MIEFYCGFDPVFHSFQFFILGSESQRNAAMLAAAAVRAAAAASTRGSARSGFPTPNAGGINNYPFGPRGLNTNTDQMPSPFPSQGLQSPDFGGMMSPNKDVLGMNSSPMSQGRGTPRNGNPPPYSPMSHSNDSNHSGSGGSIKGSFSNLDNIPKLSKTEEIIRGPVVPNESKFYIYIYIP